MSNDFLLKWSSGCFIDDACYVLISLNKLSSAVTYQPIP